MNKKELLQWGVQKLQESNIEDSFLKARLLAEYILKQTRSEYLINELQKVGKEKEEAYRKGIEELIQGTPIQYITYEQYFMGLCFYVNENVLIPQPDTEILVEKTIEVVKNMQHKSNYNDKISILDIGTGSGAIAISLTKQLNNVQVMATDISEEALKVAQKNAKEHQVNIQFIQSDLFQELKEEQFDIIVSNPPYIETNVISTLSKEVQSEPLLALDGGEDGLDFYRSILQNASKYLKENGYLLLEIGYNQGKALLELANQNNWKVESNQVLQDLNGNDRVIILQDDTMIDR
ncbi:MAG: peptide chain release factor N(5)-glutamine methyltransferase [Clostridia bacterium]|nr:peptide chain release factor N(5)-glutamine methyltransferase [Clostridia bacterium]